MGSDSWRALKFSVGTVFTPGAPISERELFSGRLDQVRTILDTISQLGCHAVLYGERGVGKTSLSNVLQSFLLQGDDTIFHLPRVNCDASDTFTSLWKKQFQDMSVTDTRLGMGFVAPKVNVSRQLVEDLPEKLTPDDVRRTLDRLSEGVILVPVFDEFDRVTNDEVSVLMADTIKVLSDFSVRATIILIGVADSVEELINEHQSIERALVQVPMQRMSNAEIAEIVKRGLNRLKLEPANGVLAEIVNLSQGLPYVTHLLALHATRAAIDRQTRKVSVSDVGTGMRASLTQWQQSIKNAYYHATKSHYPGHIFKEVILACAFAENDDLGYFSAASVREPLRLITKRSYDIPNFSRHLKQFSGTERRKILYRTGEKRRVRYRFNNPLMRPYIVMRGLADNIITRDELKDLYRLSSDYSKD